VAVLVAWLEGGSLVLDQENVEGWIEISGFHVQSEDGINQIYAYFRSTHMAGYNGF
jgi:hypothetical protein